MQILSPTPEQAPYGLRAMTMVARAADGGLAQPHRAVLAAAQKRITETALDIDKLPDIAPQELARHFADQPDLSRQLVRGMVLLSLAVGPPSQTQIALVNGFAQALAVEEPAVRTIERLTAKNLLLFRYDIYRRGNVGDYLRNHYRQYGGIIGAVKALLGLQGLVKDPALAGRFHALANLPKDTLGFHLHRFYAEHGFAFPGEKGGFALGGMFHDIGHVLSGYDTSPQGEMLNAAFQAGYRGVEDAFYTVLFATVIHCAGVNIAPIDIDPQPGTIGKADVAEQMIIAMGRGAAMNTDLGDGWDFWPWLEMPLDEARARLGVPPLPGPLEVGDVGALQADNGRNGAAR